MILLGTKHEAGEVIIVFLLSCHTRIHVSHVVFHSSVDFMLCKAFLNVCY